MGSLPPRAVFVTRETDFDLLLTRHATREQARFFLERRGQSLEILETQHKAFTETLEKVRAIVPPDWRHAHVSRGDLDRFLFTPEDVVIAVGQDGLVANTAKYLEGQAVIGINPSPDLYDGILVRHPPGKLAKLLDAVITGARVFEPRTMVEARLESGERLTALNEIFVGHRSHQSARYFIETPNAREEQSSSGLIVASGTGATGWARSIMETTGRAVSLAPTDRSIGYFVREPFPSIRTGTSIQTGLLKAEASMRITSHMNEGGVIFADGVEADFLSFDWGRVATLQMSHKTLNLVTG